MKIIPKKLMKGKESLVLNEIKILKSISGEHPNIVNLVDYFESPNNLYLIMELCTGGELYDRLYAKGNYFEKDARNIIKTVLGAVKFIHSRNIVHRDLKPENLIFRNKDADSDLMLADFGLSKFQAYENEKLKSHCGTPGYMAPEIIKKTGHGKEVDLWSIGVLTFYLLSGTLPFESESNLKEIELVLTADYSFSDPIWANVSNNGT